MIASCAPNRSTRAVTIVARPPERQAPSDTSHGGYRRPVETGQRPSAGCPVACGRASAAGQRSGFPGRRPGRQRPPCQRPGPADRCRWRQAHAPGCPRRTRQVGPARGLRRPSAVCRPANATRGAVPDTSRRRASRTHRGCWLDPPTVRSIVGQPAHRTRIRRPEQRPCQVQAAVIQLRQSVARQGHRPIAVAVPVVAFALVQRYFMETWPRAGSSRGTEGRARGGICASEALDRCVGWSGRRDSNPRHSAWEADTLPAELLPLGLPDAWSAARADYHWSGP